MVYIQPERRARLALCFQLLLDGETVIFFPSCFLSFIFSLSVSIVFFRRIFRSALRSLTHSLPLPRPPSAPDKRERPFCFSPDHSFDYFAFLAYVKSTGCFVV